VSLKNADSSYLGLAVKKDRDSSERCNKIGIYGRNNE
jgi:hypothetical protein